MGCSSIRDSTRTTTLHRQAEQPLGEAACGVRRPHLMATKTTREAWLVFAPVQRSHGHVLEARPAGQLANRHPHGSGRVTTQMRAEHSAALVGMPALDDLATRFPWVERQYERSYESCIQLALEEALQKRKFMPVELTEVPAEPWNPKRGTNRRWPSRGDSCQRPRSFLERWRRSKSREWCTSGTVNTFVRMMHPW